MAKAKHISRIPVPKAVEHGLDTALDKALSIQRPAVAAYVARVRRRKPGASPADVVRLLERRYLGAVVGTGAASGGAAALPGVGTGASIAAAGAEIAAFVSTTALYVLGLAEVYGIPAEDPQVRRALVLTVLLGDVGAAAMAGADVEAKHWARVVGRTGSKEVKGINARITHLFLTRFGAKQGALVAGRALPFGIGAGVGAAGNAALGRNVVRSARRAFGPPPTAFGGRVIDVEDARTKEAGSTPSARRAVAFRRKSLRD